MIFLYKDLLLVSVFLEIPWSAETRRKTAQKAEIFYEKWYYILGKELMK
jgi:hypothetical protein